MNETSMNRFSRVVGGAVGVAFFGGVVGLVVVNAQGKPGEISSDPFAALAARLAQVLAIVERIDATVNPAAQEGVVTIKTGFLHADVATSSPSCSMVNLGSTTVTNVNIRIRDSVGSLVGFVGAPAVAPGTGGGAGGLIVSDGIYRCEISYEGPVGAVRGTFELLTGSPFHNHPTAALEAR